MPVSIARTVRTINAVNITDLFNKISEAKGAEFAAGAAAVLDLIIPASGEAQAENQPG